MGSAILSFIFFFNFYFFISWRLITLQYCSASSALEHYHVKEGTGDIFPTVHNLCFFKYDITWQENFLRDKSFFFFF